MNQLDPSNVIADNNVYWFTIEGIDATGKTTLANALISGIQSMYPETEVRLFPEFSNTSIGKTITEVLLGNDRFMSLGYDYDAPCAETLLLACDQYIQAEKVLRNTRRTIVIGDRGPDSRVAFQSIILPQSYPNISSDIILNWLFSLFSLLPEPNKTFLLYASINSIQERITERGEPMLDEKQAQFLLSVQEQYFNLARSQPSRFTIIDADQPFPNVYTQVYSSILSQLAMLLS